jgi:primase-polymerase (primpol)-like protein
VTARYESFEAFFLDLHREVKGPRADPSTNGHGTHQGAHKSLVPDDVIIEKIRTSRSAEKFEALFDRGDITGYEGESEADWGLLYVLRYWTQDPDQLRRLMARSALDRPRHHERHSGGQTRIEYTISRRLDGAFKTYDWPGVDSSSSPDPLA